MQPKALSSRMSHTSSDEAIMDSKEPKNQRMPSLESNERTPSILVAERSHERMMSNTSPTISPKANRARRLRVWRMTLFFIGMQVVDVKDAEFDGSDDQARRIDATTALREEFLDKFVLSFLKALHTERHAPQIGNLFLGIA